MDKGDRDKCGKI